MISDLRAAELCLAVYGADAVTDKEFDVFDEGLDDGVCWAIARAPDCDIIVLRGSVTAEDWVCDILARPFSDRRMGPVHSGFLLGLDHAWSDISRLLRGDVPVIIAGHSLGAARAALLTAIMMDAGRTPARRVAFGEPMPGFPQLADFIRPVPARSYCNSNGAAHDVVTDLPFNIPALRLDYVHPVPRTFVTAAPAIDDSSGMFVLHHMPLYVDAVANFSPPGA